MVLPSAYNHGWVHGTILLILFSLDQTFNFSMKCSSAYFHLEFLLRQFWFYSEIQKAIWYLSIRYHEQQINLLKSGLNFLIVKKMNFIFLHPVFLQKGSWKQFWFRWKKFENFFDRNGSWILCRISESFWYALSNISHLHKISITRKLALAYQLLHFFHHGLKAPK